MKGLRDDEHHRNSSENEELISTLQERLADARRVLGAIQWGYGGCRCAWCGSPDYKGHDLTCDIYQVLGGIDNEG